MAHIDIKLDERPVGKVARVTLCNSAKANCLTSELVQELEDSFRKLAPDESIRTVVLTGEGERSFIAGANLHELGAFDPTGARTYISGLQAAIQAIRDMPVPVIARINGACMGAGLEVAAGCDVRIASDNAKFAMPEVLFDIPSVIEAALLPRLIGWGRTSWLLYRGDAIDAATAEAWGLIEKRVPLAGLDEAVEETVDVFLKNGAAGMRLQKKLMRDWEQMTIDDGIKAGIDSLANAYAQGEPNARIADFLKK